ncbi:MAG: alpha/beta fold hydrolase [Promethearchaeia archaeon]
MEIKTKKIEIPVKNAEISLQGLIYSSAKTPKQSAWVINCHGLLEHKKSTFTRFFSKKFAAAGYYVVSYDYRAHGETAEQTGKNWLKHMPEIFTDIRDVISWIYEMQTDKLKDEKIVLFGRSLGGAIILTQGFLDERADFLIPLCTRYDYSSFHVEFPQDLIKKMSAKYFLRQKEENNERILIGHCKDDNQIPFENVLKIKDHLGLQDENVMIFDEGGHSFDGKKEIVFKKIMIFFRKIEFHH